MQEYERTSPRSPILRRPRVDRTSRTCSEARRGSQGRQAHILRSDGGLASSATAAEYPVNLLCRALQAASPRLWVAVQAASRLLTVDVGGTSPTSRDPER